MSDVEARTVFHRDVDRRGGAAAPAGRNGPRDPSH
jgi:hypothetical protein